MSLKSKTHIMASALLYILCTGWLSNAALQIPTGNLAKLTFESELVEQLYAHYSLGQLRPIDTVQLDHSPESVLLLYAAAPELSRSIVVQLRNQHVLHVGVHLFDATELDGFHPVAHFLERRLLQAYSQGLSPETTLSLLESQRIHIRLNGSLLGSSKFVTNDVRTIIPYLIEDRTCSLQWESYRYTLTCNTTGGDRIEVDLPAVAELTLGKNKVEMQNALHQTIEHLHIPEEWQSPCMQRVPASSLVSHRRGLLRTQEKTLRPGVRSELYYEDKALELVRNPDEWLEYLNNFLLCPSLFPSAHVRVNHRMYGGDAHVLERSFNSLSYYFKASDYDTYLGFEQGEDKSIRGTLIFKHKQFDHNHLLVINKLDPIAISKKDKRTLHATMYSYIRNDNVASLYGSYVDREGNKIGVNIDP